jgi:uncharacterized phage protein (TIGR01671 family)
MNKIPNYRVWHKIEKRFVDLRTIDFELDSIGYDCYREVNYYDVAKFDEIVFQQYTGLKDSKGVDIYEGDIIEFEIPLHNEKFETPLRNKKHIAVIKFCNYAFTVVAKSEDHWFSIKFLHEIHDDICNLKLIVIDNIFERDKPWERFENSKFLNNEN